MQVSVPRDIGLADSEIRVYFALLELEESTVGPIVERSKVPDSKIYFILEKLKERGLCGVAIKNNTKHFYASDPRNLVKIIEERQTEIEEQKKMLISETIPQIEARRKLKEDVQEALIYESYNGVRSAFGLILSSLKRGDEYQVFMLGEALKEKKVVRFFRNYHKKRIEAGIKVRLISDNSFKGIINKEHRYRNMKIKFTDLKMPTGIFIFEGFVMTVTWGESPTAFLMKSKKNYFYYKKFFDNIWDISKA